MNRPMKFLNLLHILHREHDNDSTVNRHLTFVNGKCLSKPFQETDVVSTSFL
jgi:hypothetical protein